jgi:hypothetical protein
MAPHRLDYFFDCSCTHCGKFRISDSFYTDLLSNNFNDKEKLSAYLNSNKNITSKMVILRYDTTPIIGELEEAVRNGLVIDIDVDEITR